MRVTAYTPDGTCAVFHGNRHDVSPHTVHDSRWLMSLKFIHFQSIFMIVSYLKKIVSVQKCGITHQTVMQQEIQEKEDIAVEGAESG